MNKDLIIAKQKELIEKYKSLLKYSDANRYHDGIVTSVKTRQLESELHALESEQEGPTSKGSAIRQDRWSDIEEPECNSTEQSSSEELRDELIKFANTLMTLPVAVWEVDEYLKSLSKEQK